MRYPRDYQNPIFKARDKGVSRFVLCWHRRAGKDKTALNFTIREMVQRVGSYFYLLPTYSHGRKIIWEGIDRDGFKFLHHFPESIVAAKNDTEMRIELINGSIFRVVGSDNYDSIVGTNPIGCVFSEFSLQNPRAWDFVRPILRENGGWALFIATPRGHNHFFDILETGKKNDWFTQVLTVEDSNIISKEMIEQERREGMDEDLIQQEYFCSFEASVKGAYYSEQMKKCKNEDRVCRILYDPDRPVHTAWDIGRHDSNAILFFQIFGKEIRFIDYDERSGESVKFYVKLLKDKGYNYGRHYFPHDMKITDYSAERSRIDTFQDTYRDLFSREPDYKIVAKVDIQDGIESVRALFPRFWFDSEKCKFAIEAITQYCKEYDEDHKIFRSRPLHDWSSHCADSLRYLAVGLEEELPRERKSGSPWHLMEQESSSPYEF